ncbi:MAG: hypothetical protein ACRECY_00860 [Phyllobacterium sp.]
MFDLPLILVCIFAAGVLATVVYCYCVIFFAKPDGDPVEPTTIDAVDLMMFQSHDDK